MEIFLRLHQQISHKSLSSSFLKKSEVSEIHGEKNSIFPSSSVGLKRIHFRREGVPRSPI